MVRSVLNVNLINKRYGSRFGSETVDPTQVYLEEFVANVLRDNIGIVMFDLRVHESCYRPKTPKKL